MPDDRDPSREPDTRYVPPVPDEGLDEDKLAALLRWGTGLQADAREEVAAAGRAIVMLVEEVERLHVLLWAKRLYPATTGSDEEERTENDATATTAETRDEERSVETPSQPLFESLRRRLRPARAESPRSEAETVGDDGLAT